MQLTRRRCTVARCIARLIEPSDGAVLIEGADVAHLGTRALRPHRKRVQIIFQDPYRSLNPRRTVGSSIVEGPMNFGLSRREATLEACQLRLRPILMTSFAFILGVVPLMLANGAGAEMRRTLGTAVFSGMLGVTLFGIFLTPVFFYVIEGFVETPFFAAERTRWVGRVLRFTLGALTLGLLWLPALVGRALRRRPHAPAGPRVVAVPLDTDGAGSNGNGKSHHAAGANGHAGANGAAVGNGEVAPEGEPGYRTQE